jgi:glycine betaine/proline transport system substrate-binding protein
VFKDPEAPTKGRFLNSPIGWTSEVVNKQKLKAYGLEDSYVNFRSGSGAALDAEISSRSVAANRCCSITGRPRRCSVDSN